MLVPTTLKYTETLQSKFNLSLQLVVCSKFTVQMRYVLVGSRAIRCCKSSLRSLKSSLRMMLSFVLCFLVGSITYVYMASSPEPQYWSGSLRLLPINASWTPRQDHCDVTEVQSWKKSAVTIIQPRIEADCRALRAGDEEEFVKVKEKLRTWKNMESEEHFLMSLNNCSHVVEEYFNNFYISPEEESFPLAYILVVYTNVRQVLRLLKVIYRPQNLYCIHPDARQGIDFLRPFLHISNCLSNVFVASKLESVYHGHHSIFDAQLNCMQDLLKFETSRWKYVINLCGRELPLMTNREIVQSLMKLNGSSAIDSFEVPEADLNRLTYKVAPDSYYDIIDHMFVTTFGRKRYTWSRLGPVPYGMKIYKGWSYMANSRAFVSFFLTNETAIALREYIKDVNIPEEHFYASLYRLPDVPGSHPKKGITVPHVYKCVWLNIPTHPLCRGIGYHKVCIVSSGDLPLIYSQGVNGHQPTFFFNKYFMEMDHVVMDCMEQRLVEQNRREYENDCLAE